ncbi:MAG: cupin domain-containing protein [Euryarchaeota archaeon]|nr:cupin domain-containing protein [Euryarchaeota archaeon]
MQIIKRTEAIERTKSFPGGEELRRYYLPSQNPLEIIETLIPSGVSQTPHAHKLVREAMLVLEGKVIVAEIVSGVRKEYELNAGDFAVFNPGSCHMMSNQSNTSARTLTFKFLGVKKNSKLFATDKIEECTGLIKSTEGNLTQNKRI